MQPRFYAPGNLTLVVDEVEAYINNGPAYLVIDSLSSVGRERRGQPQEQFAVWKTRVQRIVRYDHGASDELCQTCKSFRQAFDGLWYVLSNSLRCKSCSAV
jgi:hypothetical protein